MSRLARRVWDALSGRTPQAALPRTRLTFVDEGNQWYPPVFATPATLGALVQGGAAVTRARGVLERLDCDAYHRFVLGFYASGLETFGDGWQYADLYTALSGVAAAMQPSRYLEIGVRRGHSMAMVLSQAPRCQAVGFDLWIQEYAGLANPGKEFVREQLGRLGHSGEVDFVDGDSTQTVPAYFRQHPDAYFDLVTVDGDHSRRGAIADLANVLPRVALGGVVVFDDICNPSHPELRGAWTETLAAHPGFVTWSYDQAGFGVALALRVA
jgi:predicted O-methyltransferase YrrM